MKTKSKKTTFLLILNKWLRTPQRISHSTLETRTTVRIETFKNKKIVFVYSDINPRFLNRI